MSLKAWSRRWVFEAVMWLRQETNGLNNYASPVKRFWHSGDKSHFKHHFSYQIEGAVLNMEDSIKPGKSIFHWLSPEWERTSCSQRKNSIMGLGNWLMVNWCFNTGKQMNIWRTPGCELPHDAVSCWLPACAQFTLSKVHPASFRRGGLQRFSSSLWPLLLYN